MKDSDLKNYLISTNRDLSSLSLKDKTLLEIIEEMIKVKSKISPNYGKNWSCAKKLIKDLELESSKPFYPEYVTDSFWNSVIPYLLNERKFSISTVKTVFSQIKSAVSWGSKYGAGISDTYDSFKFPYYKKEFVSLSQDEVSFIYHFNIDSLPKRKQLKQRLKRIKDMFVLSCNLGQRYSDMIRIDPKCFNRNIFTITQQKTGATATLDIDKLSLDSETVYEILNRYGNYSPWSKDISNYDRGLKELLGYIGDRFDKPVKIEDKILGKIKTTIKPKLKFITSHTARRTFVTININRGINILTIRKATGHQSQCAFERYICMK